MSNPQVSVDPRLHFLMDAHFVTIYKADLLAKNERASDVIDTYMQVARDIEGMVSKEFGKGPLEFMENRSGNNSSRDGGKKHNDYELPMIFENEALVYVKAQAVNAFVELETKVDNRFHASV